MPPLKKDALFSLIHRNVSIRAVLVLAFVIQIVGAVGLVGYLSFQNGQKTVRDLATQLRQELTARIERELQGYFETPHEINRLNADAFLRGDLDILEGSFGESQLYQQMRISPNVAFIYCGSAASGEFFGVLRSPQTGFLQLSFSNSDTNFRRVFYSLDVNGDRTFFRGMSERMFDSRQRPWYSNALRSQGPTWTNIYIAFTTKLPNITAALPVYSKDGRELLGVCATDVVLPEEFRAFLQNLDIGNTGQAFVVDRQGNLISNSTDEPLLSGSEDSPQSLKAVDSADPLVRGAANYLQTQLGGFNRITNETRREFDLNGQKLFLDVVPFQDEFGLDWLIVVAVPEADFMEQINLNTRNTAILCGVALLVAIALGILTARWISRPVYGVAEASKAIAKGNLDQYIEPSGTREVQSLAHSFNRMSDRLKQSFEALRQREAANRAIITAMPDLLIRVKGDGTYLEITGSDRLAAIHDPEQFQPGSHVNDSLPPDLAALRMHHIHQALETRQLQVYEQCLSVNGTTFYEEVRVLVLDTDEVLIIVRNVTNRKQAEEALRIAEENYRSIYENALEGIFQSTPDGMFISVNPAMALIYGYDSPEDMVSSVRDISSQIYVDPADQEKFEHQMNTAGFIKDFEYRVFRKDGSVIWIHEDTRAVQGNDGTVLYYEGIVQDVTERNRLKEALKREVQELQIEIDQPKLKAQVSQITESDYFQELQQAVKRIRSSEFWD